jgi:putative ABC transport system permease protein
MLGPIAAASLRVGFDTLRANPLRTLLSTLGIIMGVAALVSVLSLGDGMEQFARSQIERTTDLHGISISPSLFRTVDGQRFPRSDVVGLERADADTVRALAGPTATVTLLVTGQALVTTRADSTPHVADVTGTFANVARELPTPVAHGRFFTADEDRRDAPVVVLSDALARQLVRSHAPASFVGDSVLFQGRPYAVVGVLAENKASRGAVAYMPVGAAHAALPPALVGRPTTLMVKAARVEDVTPIRGRVEQWLEGRYGRAWKERVSVGTNQTRVEQVQQGMLVFKLFMGALTGISLLVGGIGIMNVLLASVVERTREIGIRKATGAQHRDILLQFLSESVTITGVGSMIGLVLGTGAAFGATAIMRRVTSAQIFAGFSVSTFAVAVAASVLVGIAFGLYPALRAARLSPIEAIHHE